MFYNEYGAQTELGTKVAKEYRCLTKKIIDEYQGVNLQDLLAICISEIDCTICEERIIRATKNRSKSS